MITSKCVFPLRTIVELFDMFPGHVDELPRFVFS